MDEASILEEATQKLCAPLVDVYALPSHRYLLEGCTRAVVDSAILKGIAAEPRKICTKLEEEIKNVKEEKDLEKKEAQKLNAELTAASNEGGIPASVNADNAEQLMYVSAGLSLVILPEKDASGFDITSYPHRAPVNPETGQRVQSISAAAVSGREVMLDRAWKVAAMRTERQRRRQLQLLAGEDPNKESESDNYSRLSLLSNTATVTPLIVPAAKQPTPTPVTSSEAPIAPAPTMAATTTTTTASTTSTKPTTTTANRQDCGVHNHKIESTRYIHGCIYHKDNHSETFLQS